MKVVLITNLYEPYNRGGAEVIVKRTAEEMVRQGHNVSIISAIPWSGWKSLDPEIEEKAGIRIIRFFPLNIYFYANDYKYPSFIRFFWHFFDLFNFQSSHLIRDVLDAEKPDLVITHNLMGLGYFIPGVIKRAGIKHIHVLHDIQLAVRSGLMKKGDEQAWFVRGFFARVYQRIVKSLFGSPDIVISPSDFLMNFYTQKEYFPKSQKHVLRNPVDKRFLSVPASQTASVSPGIPRFAYIGQLADHKGLRTLMKAISQLDEPLQLEIIGDGPMKQEIESWAGQDDRVTFRGKIPNEELPELYSSIEAVILPTETYENSPTVIFESFATGTPVIVSNIGGAAEPIQDGENGLIFEPGNASELLRSIKKMMQAHHLMGEKARESVKGMEASSYVSKLTSL
jgi:glycosyltransferase involved in cell wall biosynthesis